MCRLGARCTPWWLEARGHQRSAPVRAAPPAAWCAHHTCGGIHAARATAAPPQHDTAGRRKRPGSWSRTQRWRCRRRGAAACSGSCWRSSSEQPRARAASVPARRPAHWHADVACGAPIARSLHRFRPPHPTSFPLRARAVTIQRFWRGHRGRRHFAAAREVKDRQLRQVIRRTSGFPPPRPAGGCRRWIPEMRPPSAPAPTRPPRPVLRRRAPPWSRLLCPCCARTTHTLPARRRRTFPARRQRSSAAGAATRVARACMTSTRGRPTWRRLLAPTRRRAPRCARCGTSRGRRLPRARRSGGAEL